MIRPKTKRGGNCRRCRPNSAEGNWQRPTALKGRNLGRTAAGLLKEAGIADFGQSGGYGVSLRTA